MLVRINKAMLRNASGGFDTPPMRCVIPRPMSREIYRVAPKAMRATRQKGWYTKILRIYCYMKWETYD